MMGRSRADSKDSQTKVKGLISIFFLYDYGPKENVDPIFHRRCIDFGYRNNYDTFQTLGSLFRWHNETMNIWSHLIGFCCAVISAISIVSDEYFSANSQFSNLHFTPTESIILGLFCASAAFCFLASSFYHWFNCMSLSHHENLLTLDFLGVAVLVGCSFTCAIFWGFSCFPELQKKYMVVSGVVLLTGLSAPFVKVKIAGHSVQPFIFAGLVVIGLLPSIHWALVTPPFYRDKLLKGVCLLFFWYGIGFILYITAFPERNFPKRFFSTIILSSHTLWHICVLFACYSQFHHILQYQLLLQEHGCLTEQ